MRVLFALPILSPPPVSPIVDLVVVDGVAYLFRGGEDLSVSRHTESRLSGDRNSVVVQHEAVEFLVRIVLRLFEFFVPFLLPLLLLRHINVNSIRDLLQGKGPLHETQYVLGDDGLDLEGQVFLHEIVSRPNHPEVVVSSEAN